MKYSFQNELTKCILSQPWSFPFFSQWTWLWWLKAAYFLFSLTIWKQGYEALSSPWGTSSAFCTAMEICWHVQHARTRHGGRQAHTAVLEPPQSWCTQVDGAMTWALPFCPTMYICGFCWVPAQCRWLWPLPPPKDLFSQYTSSGKSSWAAGASHWDFPWTSPSLVLNQAYLFCLHTIILRSESGSQATYKRAGINLHVSVFGDKWK